MHYPYYLDGSKAVWYNIMIFLIKSVALAMPQWSENGNVQSHLLTVVIVPSFEPMYLQQFDRFNIIISVAVVVIIKAPVMLIVVTL